MGGGGKKGMNNAFDYHIDTRGVGRMAKKNTGKYSKRNEALSPRTRQREGRSREKKGRNNRRASERFVKYQEGDYSSDDSDVDFASGVSFAIPIDPKKPGGDEQDAALSPDTKSPNGVSNIALSDASSSESEQTGNEGILSPRNPPKGETSRKTDAPSLLQRQRSEEKLLSSLSSGETGAPEVLDNLKTPLKAHIPAESPFRNTLPDDLLSPTGTIPSTPLATSLSLLTPELTQLIEPKTPSHTLTRSAWSLKHGEEASEVGSASPAFLSYASTPQSAITPVTRERYRTRQLDLLSKTLFEALFGRRRSTQSAYADKKVSDPNEGEANPTPVQRIRRWDDTDSDSDEEDECGIEDTVTDPAGTARVDAVDEEWFRQYISGKTQTLTDKAGEFVRRIRNRGMSPKCTDVGSISATPKARLYRSAEKTPIASTGELSSGQEIIDAYIGTSFIRCLAEELAYEDERFVSPKVTVLKALYKVGSAGMRHSILKAVIEALYTRYERCCAAFHIAKSAGVEVNLVAARGMADLNHPHEAHAALVRGETCNFHSSTADGSKACKVNIEREGAKVRDSDIATLELLQFVAGVHITEAVGASMLKPEAPETQIPICPTPQIDKHASSLLWHLAKATMGCLRSYGSSLGGSPGTESAEYPAILDGILKTLHQIFAAATYIPASAELESFDSRMSGSRINSIDSDSLGVLRISAASDIAEECIRCLLRQWPRGGNDNAPGAAGGSSYAREVAFLSVAEIALSHALPFRIADFKATKDTRGFSTGSSTGSASTLPQLALPARKTPVQRCVALVIEAVTSLHFKVAQRALAAMQNPHILMRFCIHPPDHAFVQHYLPSALDSINGAEDLLTESCSEDSALGGSPEHTERKKRMKMLLAVLHQASLRGTRSMNVSDHVVEDSAGVLQSLRDAASAMEEARMDTLDRLVNALRSNRSHWQPQVQTNSARMFDFLLEHLD